MVIPWVQRTPAAGPRKLSKHLGVTTGTVALHSEVLVSLPRHVTFSAMIGEVADNPLRAVASVTLTVPWIKRNG